jgi:hypothetical protein
MGPQSSCVLKGGGVGGERGSGANIGLIRNSLDLGPVS